MDYLDEVQILDLTIRIRNVIRSLNSIRNRVASSLSEELDDSILALQYILTEIIEYEDYQDSNCEDEIA